MCIEGHSRKVDVPAQPSQTFVRGVPSLDQILGKRQVGGPRLRFGDGIELGSHQLLLFLIEPNARDAIDE